MPTSEAKKSKRARSRKRGQDKKQANREAQAHREAANKKLTQEGSLTPWQKAQDERAKRRQPLRVRWMQRHKQDVLSAS